MSTVTMERTAHPYDLFHNRITDLMNVCTVIFRGDREHIRPREEIEGFSQARQCIEDFTTLDDRMKTLWLRVSLTYGLVLLEEMVHEYARLAYEPTSYAERLQEPPGPETDSPMFFYPLNEELLDHERWSKFLTRLACHAFGSCPTEIDRQEQAIQAVARQGESFSYWGYLFTARIIRNIEIHNGGRMDARNFERLPLCEVGHKPVWGMDLYSDVHTCLHLLNDHLAEIKA